MARREERQLFSWANFMIVTAIREITNFCTPVHFSGSTSTDRPQSCS